MYFIGIISGDGLPHILTGEEFAEAEGATKAAQEIADEYAMTTVVLEQVAPHIVMHHTLVKPCVWAPCGHTLCAEFSGAKCKGRRGPECS